MWLNSIAPWAAAVRAKALEITRNSADAKSKVRALHHWVASNIRYISVALADGALVPRSADSVRKNLYGDCKDHVVLLEALLAAVGIDSSPALINSGKAYSLSSIGIGGPLNHVITYVPALDLYIDSTDPMSPFGTLPFEVMDKPVLLTALNRTGRTPAMKAAEHVTENRLEMTVRNDGTIAGKGHATLTGVTQIRSRSARKKDSRAEDSRTSRSFFSSSSAAATRGKASALGGAARHGVVARSSSRAASARDNGECVRFMECRAYRHGAHQSS
jgi:hypothetical protein